jgi:hypothetical protein
MPSLRRVQGAPAQTPKIQIKKEESEQSTLLVRQPVVVELNKNPFKWSKRIGVVIVVANFFYIVYILLMVVVATLVLELHSDNISVAQQQSYRFPVFYRAIEVSSICSAGLLAVSLSIGIISILSCLSIRKQLIISWIHFSLNLLFSTALMVLASYYFIILANSWMSSFFLSILGVFVAGGVLLALARAIVLTREYSTRAKELEYNPELMNEM